MRNGAMVFTLSSFCWESPHPSAESGRRMALNLVPMACQEEGHSALQITSEAHGADSHVGMQRMLPGPSDPLLSCAPHLVRDPL